jgi:hypothetical protein
MDSHSTEHAAVGHEISTVNLKPVIAFAIVMVLVTIFSFASMGFFLDFLRMNHERNDTPLSPLAKPNPEPPAPRLQVSPSQDLKQMRQTENAVLHAYHWVDKNTGVVGIPVERAMEVLAERGLPSRNAAGQ